MEKLNLNKVIDVLFMIIFIALMVSAIYGLVEFYQDFGYSSELGLYYTRVYSFTIGEIINGGSVHYEYTNLNLMDVLKLIY